MKIDEQTLKSLCEVIKDWTTGSQIGQLLASARITDKGLQKQNVGGYMVDLKLSKTDRLMESFVAEINGSQNYNKLKDFIERLAAPARFVNSENRDAHSRLIEELNRPLLLIGLQLNNQGKLSAVTAATTIDEVDRRLNSLHKKLYDRTIHNEIHKYCTKDILKNDYFDMIVEAAKGLAERVRQLTGLTDDSLQLYKDVFTYDPNKPTVLPYLAFNSLKTQSEQNEQQGLLYLTTTIWKLYRCPLQHTPKINWRGDESKALDALAIISLAHKLLDECIRTPRT